MAKDLGLLIIGSWKIKVVDVRAAALSNHFVGPSRASLGCGS